MIHDSSSFLYSSGTGGTLVRPYPLFSPPTAAKLKPVSPSQVLTPALGEAAPVAAAHARTRTRAAPAQRAPSRPLAARGEPRANAQLSPPPSPSLIPTSSRFSWHARLRARFLLPSVSSWRGARGQNAASVLAFPTSRHRGRRRVLFGVAPARLLLPAQSTLTCTPTPTLRDFITGLKGVGGAARPCTGREIPPRRPRSPQVSTYPLSHPPDHQDPASLLRVARIIIPAACSPPLSLSLLTRRGSRQPSVKKIRWQVRRAPRVGG